MSIVDLIIIDGGAVCHAVKHGIKTELDHNELRTEIIFGFTNKIRMYARKFQCPNFAFAWDSKSSKRKNIFPAYKEKRQQKKKEKSPEEKKFDNLCYQQFDEIRKELLPMLGFNNSFIWGGYEADDIIAHLAAKNKDLQYVTISGDEDLYQTLTDNHALFSSASIKVAKLTTKFMFKKKWGIEPEQWAEVKAIAGCKSDEVPGIDKCGEAKAVRYILGTLPRGKVRDRIQSSEGQAIITRNRKLVTLPFDNKRECSVFPEPLFMVDFQKAFDHYGFRSHTYPEEFRKWIEAMRLR